ncbi:MAG: hypothetical protein HC876_08805 [Chloroflexaceae bacterium]|nr:hypothetical protein [Chloroflexaceae bacterium]
MIGVSVADSRCLLTAEQLLHMGNLLLRLRPDDRAGVCFVGGHFATLAATLPATTARQPARIVSLDTMLGEDTFLVLAGTQGALACLTVNSPQGYHTRIYSDLERVDRAALVLAQFAATDYQMDVSGSLEQQRAFIARVVIMLLTDNALQKQDLTALLPDDQAWLRLARGLATHPDPATVLTLPSVQQMIRACGGERALIGTFEADQQAIRWPAPPIQRPRTA